MKNFVSRGYVHALDVAEVVTDGFPQVVATWGDAVGKFASNLLAARRDLQRNEKPIAI
jgi:hypothetical protein